MESNSYHIATTKGQRKISALFTRLALQGIVCYTFREQKALQKPKPRTRRGEDIILHLALLLSTLLRARKALGIWDVHG